MFEWLYRHKFGALIGSSLSSKVNYGRVHLLRLLNPSCFKAVTVLLLVAVGQGDYGGHSQPEQAFVLVQI